MRLVGFAGRHRIADGRGFGRERLLVRTAALLERRSYAKPLPLPVLPPALELGVELLLALTAIIRIISVERLHLSVAPAAIMVVGVTRITRSTATEATVLPAAAKFAVGALLTSVAALATARVIAIILPCAGVAADVPVLISAECLTRPVAHTVEEAAMVVAVPEHELVSSAVTILPSAIAVFPAAAALPVSILSAPIAVAAVPPAAVAVVTAEVAVIFIMKIAMCH